MIKDPSENPEHIPDHGSPSLFRLALEARTLLEAGGFALSYPLLQTSVKGDGHPVLVLPGFMASDFSTKLLRTFLKSRGYQAYGWELGRNLGRFSDPVTGCGEEIIQRLKHIHATHNQKVSIIGWSLGGIYARELARLQPDLVRFVITLGSPFSGNLTANHATWLFEKTSGYSIDTMDKDLWKTMRTPPPVPSTAFYSKTDGITAWECCLEEPQDTTENIEVPSSHCGMGHHPFVMWAIANRLAQNEDGWQKFDPQGFEKAMFKLN